MLSIAARLISKSCGGITRRTLVTGLPAGGLLKRPCPLPTSILTPSRTMASLKHKKVLKRAKGFRGRSNRCFTVAFHRVQKAKQYNYRDRKVKKREFRKLWILRVNAASRMYRLPYSRLINGMLRSNITLNRLVLADLAVTEPLSFKSVVEIVKQRQLAVAAAKPKVAPKGPGKHALEAEEEDE